MIQEKAVPVRPFVTIARRMYLGCRKAVQFLRGAQAMHPSGSNPFISISSPYVILRSVCDWRLFWQQELPISTGLSYMTNQDLKLNGNLAQPNLNYESLLQHADFGLDFQAFQNQLLRGNALHIEAEGPPICTMYCTSYGLKLMQDYRQKSSKYQNHLGCRLRLGHPCCPSLIWPTQNSTIFITNL